jgi:hypothetical protein
MPYITARTNIRDIKLASVTAEALLHVGVAASIISDIGLTKLMPMITMIKEPISLAIFLLTIISLSLPHLNSL